MDLQNLLCTVLCPGSEQSGEGKGVWGGGGFQRYIISVLLRIGDQLGEDKSGLCWGAGGRAALE